MISHIVYLNGVPELYARMWFVVRLGNLAVNLFIIFSGFVITHLLLTKREPYWLYITRRGFRLYPAYLVSLGLGIATAPLMLKATQSIPWMTPEVVHTLQIRAEQSAHGFMPNLLAHMLLLHGAVPNTLLPQSAFMWLAPAWSLSLEWQFYLLAPVILAALVRRPIATVAGLCVIQFASRRMGLIFEAPSALPAMLYLFLIGIGTRMIVNRLPTFDKLPTPLAIGVSALPLLTSDFGAPNEALMPLAGWIVVVLFFRTVPYQGAITVALDSPLARAAGARSYSVYLVHWPALAACLYVSAVCLHLGAVARVIFSGVGTIAITALASELMYRFIELPGIRAGRIIGTRRPIP